jgi:hypothetical protein
MSGGDDGERYQEADEDASGAARTGHATQGLSGRCQRRLGDACHAMRSARLGAGEARAARSGNCDARVYDDA